MEAKYARQPPMLVISGASLRPICSQRNPLIHSPLASLTFPITSGGGMAATSIPNAATSSSQISSSIDPPFADRIMPGLGGDVFGRTNKRYCGAVRVCSRTLPRDQEAERLAVDHASGLPPRQAEHSFPDKLASRTRSASRLRSRKEVQRFASRLENRVGRIKTRQLKYALHLTSE